MKGTTPSVVIVGVGAFAQGLASLATRSGATASYDICFGSRKMRACSGTLPGLEDTPVRSLDDAVAEADMVILALPSSALPNFVASYAARLSGKVVVDVTNPMEHDYAKLGQALLKASSADFTCDIESKDADDLVAQLDSDQNKAAAASKGSKASNNKTGGNTANPISTATWLSSVLPSSVSVVKAFNNLSAYTLIHGDPLTEHMKSVAAADDNDAAAEVAELGRSMGLEMRIVSRLAYAKVLERRQHSLLPSWQWPSLLMFMTWLVTHIYTFIRYCYYGGSAWQHVTLWILNKSVGWASIMGMVYTYLPGVLICWWQLLSRRPAVRLPRWLKAWMDARKPLGLLSLFTMLLHLLFSTFLWAPGYYQKLWERSDTAIVPIIAGTKLDQFGMMKGASVPQGLQVVFEDQGMHYANSNATVITTWPVGGGATPMPVSAAVNSSHKLEVLTTVTNIITLRSRLNWIGESSTLLGIASGVLMGMIALTSMPSITPKMNWREWRLLQAQAGWLAVITATVHVLLLGAPWWPAAKEDWPEMIPTITLLSTLPPMLLLIMKGLLVLPPCSMLLRRVRSGKWARKDDGGDDPLAHTAVYALEHH